ncbi:MAG: AIM24 family protein [Firmicutes bacterium]|nr:AIM24 family protein [Bacillota bacterium]
MNYEIWGQATPAVTIHLDKGETLSTHEGGMSWMSADMEMTPAGSKGLFGPKESFSTNYVAKADNQEITFSATRSGEIKVFDIAPGKEIIAQESLLLCAEPTVEAKTFQANISGSLYGNPGYMYQQYEGQGKLFLEFRGAVKQKYLEAGEKLIAESGNAAAWEATVSHEVQFVRDSKSMLFKGKGTLITVLTGPGKVYLQTAPVIELAKRLMPYIEDK